MAAQLPVPGTTVFRAQSEVLTSVERPTLYLQALSDRIRHDSMPPPPKRSAKLTELQETRLLMLLWSNRDTFDQPKEVTKWWERVEDEFNTLCGLAYRNVRRFAQETLRKKWREKLTEYSGEEYNEGENSWLQAANRWYEFVAEHDRLKAYRRQESVDRETSKVRIRIQRDNMARTLSDKDPVSRSSSVTTESTAITWDSSPPASDEYQNCNPNINLKSVRRKKAAERVGNDEQHYQLLNNMLEVVKSLSSSSSSSGTLSSAQISADRLEMLERKVGKLESAVNVLGELIREMQEVYE